MHRETVELTTRLMIVTSQLKKWNCAIWFHA